MTAPVSPWEFLADVGRQIHQQLEACEGPLESCQTPICASIRAYLIDEATGTRPDTVCGVRTVDGKYSGQVLVAVSIGKEEAQMAPGLALNFAGMIAAHASSARNEMARRRSN